MVTDICNLIKTELEAGTWTNHGSTPNIYIQNEDVFQGGESYIILKDGRRDPIQSFTGTIVYNDLSCRIELKAPSTTTRDNIYDDIISIFDSADNGYVIEDVNDYPDTPEGFRKEIDVKTIRI